MHPTPSSQRSMTSPREWRTHGLACLAHGCVLEAASAFTQAERLGDADSAYLLGIAKRLQGQLDDAEGAWLRVLQRTTDHALRQAAAECLSGLYRALGSPTGYAAMQHYRATVDGPRPARTPRRRVRRTSAGTWVADGQHGLLGRWRDLSRLSRITLTVISGLTTGLALVDRLRWLLEVVGL